MAIMRSVRAIIDPRRIDITTLDVDAIVNAANETLLGGGGVDGAIHRVAGPELLQECRRLGGCQTGKAKLTRGYRLRAGHVIHTVGPVWSVAEADQHDATLARCYRRSLEVAAEIGARTIGFPNISTGVYGFPKDRAASVAVEAIRQELVRRPDAHDDVVFVCFDDENFGLYETLLAEI